MQLADAPLIDMDLLYWSRHFRNMPGEGDLPVADFMRAVAATGYDGPLSLEIFNDQFRGGSPRAIAVDGHRSLVYLDGPGGARRAGARASPCPPCRRASTSQGVEFVEFAADEAEARGARQRCSTRWASPRRRGTAPRTSTLWRQGDINIVVNTEREGFAHSVLSSTHGTSVYAIGLEVDDAAATVGARDGAGRRASSSSRSARAS